MLSDSRPTPAPDASEHLRRVRAMYEVARRHVIEAEAMERYARALLEHAEELERAGMFDRALGEGRR